MAPAEGIADDHLFLLSDGESNSVTWSASGGNGLPPNGPDVDLFLDGFYDETTPIHGDVIINQGVTISIHSLSMAFSDASLVVFGTLNVAQSVSIGSTGDINLRGGILNAGSLTVNGIGVDGAGAIDISGALSVGTTVIANRGADLTISAASLANSGRLIASNGNLIVTVTPGGFSNIANNVLTGGAYVAGATGSPTQPSNILYMNVGQVVTTDAAAIYLKTNGGINFYDPLSQQYVSLQSTLQTIAAGGVLDVENGQVFQSTTLNIAGTLYLDGGTLQATQVNVSSGGLITLGGESNPDVSTGTAGVLTGVVVNNGTIKAGYNPIITSPSLVLPKSQSLTISGNVTGTGSFEIDGIDYAFNGEFQAAGTLELNGATAENVLFAQGTGTLQLDQPASFTGKIIIGGDVGAAVNSSVVHPGTFNVILQGVSLSSVTDYAYSGTSEQGTLTIHSTQGTFAYQFAGDLTTSDFALGAMQQNLGIAVNAKAPMAVAEIAVSYGGANIADGDTTPSSGEGTDFGSVAQNGAAVSRTFTVFNSGDAPLTPGPVSLPSGFSLVEGLSSSIAAGASDTFTVQLSTGSAGTFAGDIAFSTNDSDENPYNFDVTGTVAAPHENNVYRFFDTNTQDHFYTTSANEAATIIATEPNMNYEGAQWATPDAGAPDTTDVYRFLDTSDGAHFYTSSAFEKDQIIAANDFYHYEGVAFEAFTNGGGDGEFTMNRFYNTIDGLHTYSVNAGEDAFIMSGQAGPGWVNEGPSFTVHTPV